MIPATIRRRTAARLRRIAERLYPRPEVARNATDTERFAARLQVLLYEGKLSTNDARRLAWQIAPVDADWICDLLERSLAVEYEQAVAARAAMQ
jgi:hypothetical protein